ncbi:MAG: exodeoxyribonuclease V subunit alpha [Methylomonas sp.]|jgi:exodeoxyribonuclease V alpha subunit|uniref:exodeoxyribonuclease V subunit alpha n=1 Tax=Methylomonas sp. TaxID=418 RepID=UPI0025FA02BD|nr:exodeoxyribonuclease V subunit alpha [Methylomonas sp.]MCK9605915.1 exodeoxyribonuclease V subunit alpha [Methylomonas sp.]
MSQQTVLDRIEHWISLGWLSRLDRAFAGFLIDQDPAAGDSLIWAGALVSHQLGRGEVYLDLEKLCANPGATLAIPGDEVWRAEDGTTEQELALFKTHTLADWLQDLAQSSLVATAEGSTPLVLWGSRLYLRRYWQYQQILDSEIGLRLQPVREQLPAALHASLSELFSHNTEQPDWQKIACVLALRARFTIITGGPGTGKTTTLTKLLCLLIQLAADDHQRKLTILLAAPTGKAAARVSESIGNALEHLTMPDPIRRQIPQKAATLHRLLGSRPDSRRFQHHRHNPLLADIVIVDEASMIDLEMMASLLDALPATAQLILLGDKDQLASVEAGAVMGDLCRGAEQAAYDPATLHWLNHYAGSALPVTGAGSAINQQTVMLRHSHRFGAHSGIGQLARAVNSGDAGRAQAILADHTNYPDLHHILLSDAADARFKQLIGAEAGNAPGYGPYQRSIRQRPQDPDAYQQWGWEVLQAFEHFRVLCALRRGPWGVEGLNQRIEQWLFPGIKSGLWYPGRPVMISRNDYNLGLMNGDIGIALADAENKLRVVFPDSENSGGKIRWVSPMRLPDVETAFAMTVHKSQGSEFQHVALVLPETRGPGLTRELVYTGITRAKAQFTLLESRPDVFNQAIRSSIR